MVKRIGICGICGEWVDEDMPRLTLDNRCFHRTCAVKLSETVKSTPNASPEVEGANVCPKCNGKGIIDRAFLLSKTTDYTKCQRCNGTGKHEVEGTEGGDKNCTKSVRVIKDRIKEWQHYKDTHHGDIYLTHTTDELIGELITILELIEGDGVTSGRGGFDGTG